MHYYIDGYNLLFRVLRAGSDMRKQREEVTLDIERKANCLDLDITLVFDSHYQEDDSARSHYKSIEIIFTAKGETADEYILQELKESHNPSQHTVVTSDKKLARLCQLRLGKTESIDEFLGWTGKRYKNKLRQKRLLAEAALLPPLPKEPAVPKPPAPLPLPTVTDSAESCFNFYLDTFEKEMQLLEEKVPKPKKVQQEPKKIKVKKRKLTKEEEALSDAQRWLNSFERASKDEYDNFVF